MKQILLIITFTFSTFYVFSQTVPWLNRETLTGAHDPTIIKDERGVYTLMSTNNLLQIRQSTDMVNWQNRGRIFSAVPAWMLSVYAGIEDIWAPHIYFRNGRYWVYYTGSVFGKNTSLIGVASSPTLNTTAANYAWTDHGEVIRTQAGNDYNAIDPELLVDRTGRIWMTFGSYWSGIKMIEINPATGKRISSNSTLYSIASRGRSSIEGPSMIEHNGAYFLFTSWGTCCNGTSATYTTMVGRSTSPNSGFVDKLNRPLMDRNSELLLKGYGRYYGPGGGSPFKDGRRDYYVHHYYNGNENGSPRLQIREIVWDNTNWPIITQPFLGRRQSFEAEHAQISGADILRTNTASNSEYIGGIDNATSRVVFHINVLQGGEYTVRIRFSSPSGASSHFLRVNNAESEVQYPASPATVDFPEGRVIMKTVTLNEGYNTLTFRKGNGVANLDRIDLVRSAKNNLEGGSFDDSKVVNYVATGNNGTFSTGDWAQYENIDFGQGGNARALISFAGSCNGQLRINIDGVNGTVSASTSVNISSATPNHSVNMPAAITNLRGVHDLFITYTGTGGCTLDNLKFTNTITSLAIEKEQAHIAVYPNPFSETFEILSEGEVVYEVFNILGNSIANGMCNGICVIDNIRDKGTYFVRLTKQGQTQVKKIIKN